MGLLWLQLMERDIPVHEYGRALNSKGLIINALGLFLIIRKQTKFNNHLITIY